MIKVKLVPEPKHTDYFWGPITEIAGAELMVLEKNASGDCLCLMKDKGLVDVNHRDIVSSIDDGKAVGICILCGGALSDMADHDCFKDTISPAGMSIEPEDGGR